MLTYVQDEILIPFLFNPYKTDARHFEDIMLASF